MANYINEHKKYLKIKPNVKLHTDKLSDYKLSFTNNKTLKEHDVKVLKIDLSNQERYITIDLDSKDLQILAETKGFFLFRYFDDIIYTGNYVNNLNNNIDDEITYKEPYDTDGIEYKEPYT